MTDDVKLIEVTRLLKGEPKFKPGDIVVCINTPEDIKDRLPEYDYGYHQHDFYIEGITLNKVYTISECHPDNHFKIFMVALKGLKYVHTAMFFELFKPVEHE